MLKKPMIYIAGPITLPHGQGRENAIRACRLAEQLLHETDIVPMIPHWSVFWAETMSEHPRAYCLNCGERQEDHLDELCPDVDYRPEKGSSFVINPTLGIYHYTKWIDMSQQWLLRCDALFRLPGESKGSDDEVELAHKMGIPVFRSVASLKKWASGILV